MSYWRSKAKPIVDRVLAETAGQPETAIARALLSAYPFGQRAFYPYKIWRDEIARQRGKTPKLGTRGVPRFDSERKQTMEDPRQVPLFGKVS